MHNRPIRLFLTFLLKMILFLNCFLTYNYWELLLLLEKLLKTYLMQMIFYEFKIKLWYRQGSNDSSSKISWNLCPYYFNSINIFQADVMILKYNIIYIQWFNRKLPNISSLTSLWISFENYFETYLNQKS